MSVVDEQGSRDLLHSGGVEPVPFTVGPVEVVGEPPAPRGRGGVLARSWSTLRAVPGLPVVAGLLLVVAGAVLLLVAWGRTAGLTNVGLQMPYVISAGCTGLALVAIGLTAVSVAAKARDAAARREQLAELQSVLAAVRQSLEEQGR